ncbi:cardiolipin synthase [Parendozoicomonas haliclonae]|uniref:Cardiolipin synthase A n=1 Tax=Parendozoicomonas haliclonae TaxID=1960125 RepID=A0A1X7ALX4_9GAMM|nr:cardiolipin synthase [Parendozoicomonas haliclonae]SMA48672.1 Cardiolipin synthase [Parendozoicomonas haliclonae]
MTDSDQFSLISALAGTAYIALIILFILIIIMRRRPVGVSLSWLLLLFALPVAGIILFLMFGTRRLGTKRLRRAEELAPSYAEWIQHLQQVLTPDLRDGQENTHHLNRIYNLTEHTTRIPAIPGNQLMLFHNTADIFSGLIQDIEQAQDSIHLEFYICEAGGLVDDVITALEAAAQRGVTCRVLLDAVGSSSFFRSEAAARLKEAGVKVRASLPVGPIRMLFERMDLRNHRKLVIIDDAIAWTGSQNLADPGLFKQDAGVGQWVDAMVRIEGPAAHVNGAVFHYDWAMETGETIPRYHQPFEYQESFAPNSASLHVLPSGPGIDRANIHMVLLAAIYQSQKELIITTPYLVPDEALVTALCAAALRGVQVTLITPEKNDSRMVHYASRSYYEDLLDAGITIMHFTEGLLHTKCVLVDQETVLFGTVNLDMRSVWLNFELTLIIYDQAFGQHMAALIEEYISRSKKVSIKDWKERRFLEKLRENVAQLLSPLL